MNARHQKPCRWFALSLGIALAAWPSRAEAFGCAEAAARLAAVRGALDGCRASGLDSCPAASVLGRVSIPADELARLADDLESFAGESCGVSVASGRAPAPSRRMGESAALGSLSAMAGATQEPSDTAHAMSAAWGELRPQEARLAGWRSPLPPLEPLPLNPLLPPGLSPNLPSIPRVEARPEPARAAPLAPIAAEPAYPASLTPCGDLRDKARRLRGAADQCDADVAAGAPYCHVTVTFRSPSIPKTLSAGSARSYADDFDRVADGLVESACAAYGGEGVIPTLPSYPTQLQLPGSGVGDLYRRTWETRITGGVRGAHQLMDDMKSDINRFSRGRYIADTPFTYVGGPDRRAIAVGNTYRIDGPLAFNPYVRVTEVEAYSFELTTLRGHPEAGRVRFMAYDVPGGETVFIIRVYGHPATYADKGLYGVAGFWVQTQIWDNFTENVRSYCGGYSTPVERSTIKE